MKEKIENALYFLTVWFSVSVIVLGIIAIIFNNINRKQETKQIYIIQSPMMFDSLGNMTITRKVIDHKPTQQDSIEIGFLLK
jgi:hypothetical protein